MIPFPSRALRYTDCPWCGSPKTEAEGDRLRCTHCGRTHVVEPSVVEAVERERHAHGGGPRIVKAAR